MFGFGNSVIHLKCDCLLIGPWAAHQFCVVFFFVCCTTISTTEWMAMKLHLIFIQWLLSGYYFRFAYSIELCAHLLNCASCPSLFLFYIFYFSLLHCHCHCHCRRYRRRRDTKCAHSVFFFEFSFYVSCCAKLRWTPLSESDVISLNICVFFFFFISQGLNRVYRVFVEYFGTFFELKFEYKISKMIWRII